MKELNVAKVQNDLQKTITWMKKLGKGRQDWEFACKEIGLRPWKLKKSIKIRFVSRVVIFQETLEYFLDINLYYS
jgi:hypothetical protein